CPLIHHHTTSYSHDLAHCLLRSFFQIPPPPALSPLSLHDALPISAVALGAATKQYVDNGLAAKQAALGFTPVNIAGDTMTGVKRSEEHTSELQSLRHLVCRLLLEKKKKIETRRPLRRMSSRPDEPD